MLKWFKSSYSGAQNGRIEITATSTATRACGQLAQVRHRCAVGARRERGAARVLLGSTIAGYLNGGFKLRSIVGR